ncbi:MAG: sugar phosphate isomerase/epimerase, partial [Planctomycetota bacterium]
YRFMQHAIGWIHIKDHLKMEHEKGKFVDEESLHQFVPAGFGESGYAEILTELTKSYQSIEARLQKRGIPGIFADLEPHLKGGGQFGGFSGPDGFGIAAREFQKLCSKTGIACQLVSSV